jgi:hypothetical protein
MAESCCGHRRIETALVATQALRLGQLFTTHLVEGEWKEDNCESHASNISFRMTEQFVSNTKHDMFCSGTTVLPNGVVMISGGANSKATSFYDYRKNQWSEGPQMKLPRGYQAHTLLANGEVFSFGGSWSGVGVDKDGEVWSPQSNSWRLLTGVPSKAAHTGDSGGRYRADNHYWLFLAPNGKVGKQTQFSVVVTNMIVSTRFSTPVRASRCTGLQRQVTGRFRHRFNVATIMML